VVDQPGALGAITTVLGRHGVSVETHGASSVIRHGLQSAGHVVWLSFKHVAQ